MSLRPKTKRRLLLLAMATAAVVALGGAGIGYRTHYLNQRAIRSREEGVVALKKGDYYTALNKIGLYVQRYHDDPDALYDYAEAREHVEEPGHAELADAIRRLQRVIDLRPDRADARRRLIELHLKTGHNTETITSADALLHREPRDPTALRAKAGALFALRRDAEAKAAARLLLEVDPNDIDGHILMMNLIARNAASVAPSTQAGTRPATGPATGPALPGSDEVMQYADALLRAHPNDARFELIKCIACFMSSDPKQRTKAADWAKAAAAHPDANPAFQRRLIAALDDLGLYVEAGRILEQAAQKQGDNDTRRAWANRLLQGERYDDLAKYLSDLDPANPTADGQLIDLRALALVRSGHKAEATTLLDGVKARAQADFRGVTWARLIEGLVIQENHDFKKGLELCRNAISSDARSPLSFYLLGQVYNRAGEHDLAVKAYLDAVLRAPAWAAPMRELAQLAMSAGDGANGLSFVRAAVNRAPNDRETLVTAVNILGTATMNSVPDAAPQYESTLRDLHRLFPQEQRVLPIEVAVLGRTNSAQAKARLQAALEAKDAPPESVLMQLAIMARQLKFGAEWEQACLKRSQDVHGLTPDLAFTQCRLLLDENHPAEAIAYLDKTRKGHETDVAWQTIWAQLLDICQDPRAKDAWIALGDSTPDNVRVQWQALGARAVQKEHAFIGRTLDRLTALLGDQGDTLRFARARWLMAGQANSQDLNQAAAMLGDLSRSRPEVIGPRLVLAMCLERSGNISGATQQLEAVANMSPDSVPVALELVRMLQRQNEFNRARYYLDRITRNNTNATPDQVRAAAYLLAQQGDFTASLKAAEFARNQDGGKTPDLMLAALYRQQNQPDKAEPIYLQALEKPSVQAVATAADFYASRGQRPRSEEILAMLDGLQTPPGTKELIRAQFYARYDTPERATEQYLAATKAARDNVVVWRQFITFLAAGGKIDQALIVSQDAAKAVPSERGFATINANAATISTLSADPRMRPLLVTLVQNPSAEQPVVDALRILSQAATTKMPATQLAKSIRDIADRNQQIFVLQSMAVEAHMRANQPDDAAAVAMRAMQTFPTTPDPARWATGAMVVEGRWDEVATVATEWKKRETNEPLSPDLVLAGVDVQLGNSAGALRILEPYLKRAFNDPDKYVALLRLYTQAMIQDRKADRAADLLAPLLPKSVLWRAAWVDTAANQIPEPATAAAWLEKVTAVTPAEAVGERLALAQAWLTLGRRSAESRYTDVGVRTLKSFSDRPDAPPAVFILLALHYDTQNDLDSADKYYRKALAGDPKMDVAMNNLSMVAVRRNNLDEAQTLIDKAIAINSHVPNYYDTRATILAKRKNIDGAVASIEEAARIDPKNPEWRISQAEILADAGRKAKAKEALDQAEVIAGGAKLVPSLQQRIAKVRAAIK